MLAICGECHRVKGFHFLVNEGKMSVRPLMCCVILMVYTSPPPAFLIVSPIARRDVYALLKRYFMDPSGQNVVRVYFDHACSLSEVILNRDPQGAMSLEVLHDR